MESSNNNLVKIRLAQKGDQEAFDYLIRNNQALVHSLLKKYQRLKDDYEDLVAVANIGLIKAIKNFSFEYDVTFSTYAVPLVIGEVKKYFRDRSMLHVTRSIKDRYLRVINASNELETKLARYPTISEIAEYLNETQEEVLESLEAHLNPCSIDAPLNDDQDTSFSDLLEDSNRSIVDRIDLNLALEKLSKKEQLFIRLRYFDGLNQSEIGERFFISQVQVSRIEKRILKKLQEIMIKAD